MSGHTIWACKQLLPLLPNFLKQGIKDVYKRQVRGKVVLGLDPACRTGCKIAVVDATGKVLETAVVYPTPPQKKVAEAARTLLGLIRRYGVEVISIGNGTASKESEVFVADLIRENGLDVSYAVVSLSLIHISGGVYKARERIHRGMLIRDY